MDNDDKERAELQLAYLRKPLEDKVGDICGDVASIKTTLEQMSTHLATKADVNALEARVNGLGLKLIMWAVGAIIATGVLVFGIVRYTTPPSGPPTINVTIPPTSGLPPTSWPAPEPAAMPKIP